MSVSTDLQAMIWRRLVADPTLAALVGGRVLDRAPAGTVFPYVSFGPSYAVPADSECIRADVVTQQIDAWSQAQDGRREALLIVDAIKAALHGWEGDETVAITPLSVILAQVSDDPDGVSHHGIVQVEAIVEWADG